MGACSVAFDEHAALPASSKLHLFRPWPRAALENGTGILCVVEFGSKFWFRFLVQKLSEFPIKTCEAGALQEMDGIFDDPELTEQV